MGKRCASNLDAGTGHPTGSFPGCVRAVAVDYRNSQPPHDGELPPGATPVPCREISRRARPLQFVFSGGYKLGFVHTHEFNCQFDYGHHLPHTLADREAIQHILQIFLLNVIKYTLQSSITLWTRIGVDRDVESGVTDTSSGIPADQL